ncbi:hypothetical protein AAC387_Pa05g1559 [Persea americana]
MQSSKMTCTCSLLSTGAFSSSFLSQSRHSSITIKSQGAQISNHQPKVRAIKDLFVKPINNSFLHEKRSLVIQLGVLLASVNQPALAVTGNNNYEVDLTGTLISAGIVAFLYFLIMPPVILNWMRLRFYKRNLLETYVQFMFVFMFFPGLLLWAPFLNFRRFPRDPSMKYPWSTPQDSSVKDPRSM